MSIPISVTGARQGDIIKGIAQNNKDIYAYVCNNIRPLTSSVKIASLEKNYNSTIGKLGAVKFFASKSKEECKSIILAESDNYRFFNNGKIIILSVGMDNVLHEATNVGDDIYELMGVETTPSEICDLLKDIDENLGSKGSNTLGSKDKWAIDAKLWTSKNYQSDVFHLNKDGLEVIVPKQGEITYHVGVEQHAISFVNGQALKSSDMIDAINDVLHGYNIRNLNDTILRCWCILEALPVGCLKSSLQKTIRGCPRNITLNYHTVGGKIVSCDPYDIDPKIWICMVFYMLCARRGHMNQNINRFVTGRESAFKRLCVIAAEDSSPSEQYLEKLAICSAVAYFCSSVPVYYPTIEIVKIGMELSVNLLDNRKCYPSLDEVNDMEQLKYELPKPYFPLNDWNNKNYWNTIANFTSMIGSFKSDMELLYRSTHYEPHDEDFTSTENMDFYTCIDNHSAPNFIYYMTVDWFNDETEHVTKGPLLGPLFKQLWYECGSYNPRRGHTVSETIFADEIDMAQSRYARMLCVLWNIKNGPEETQTGDVNRATWTYERQLEDEWLASMVGTVNVRDENFITLRPDNIKEVIFGRKVKGREREWTEVERERKKNYLLYIFSQGIRPSYTPCDSFKNLWLRWEDCNTVISETKDEGGKRWEEVRDVKIELPLNEPVVFDRDYIKFSSYKEGWSHTDLSELFDYYHPSEIMRAHSLLSSSFTRFNMPTPTRSGKSINNDLTRHDVGAFQIIHHICEAFPSVVRPTGVSSFSVTNPVMFSLIRTKMNDAVAIYRETCNTNSFNPDDIYDRDGRELFPHQKESVRSLVSRFESGKKGSFIWLTVGSGKTLIVLTFIRELSIRGKLPPRILYTLPTPSQQSVAAELKKMGFKVVLLSPVQRKASDIGVATISSPNEWKQGEVCLITHDHIRFAYNELIPLLPTSFVVVDEVHKGLTNSIRSTVMQQCAMLSSSFVALTGTPTIDDKTSRLIPWLTMISNYPITNSNHLVAINTMISNSVNVGTTVVDDTKIVDIPDATRQEYNKLVGPLHGGINPRCTHSDLIAATKMCHDICNKYMIEDAIRYESEGKGVFLVANDNTHQNTLYELLKAALGRNIAAKPIFLVDNKNSICHTDKTVEEGATDWRFVIAPISKSEGYTCTRLSVQLTSVYWSNESTRVQIRGRINRIGQSSESVEYICYMCGILEHFYEAYINAGNVRSMMAKMVD